MRSIDVLVAWNLLILIFHSFPTRAETHQPGFRVILTEKGLEYAHQVGLTLLKEFVCNYSIPDFNISSTFGLANINYNFTNIVIHSLDFGESTVTSDPAGLVVSVERATISFSTDWSIIEDDWPYFTDNGNVRFTADGISLSATTEVLMTNGTDEGHFALNAIDCSFTIDDIDTVFSGGSSYFYNMFGLAINDFLKHELKKKACSQVINFINTSGNKYVESLPVIINISDGVEISYALVHNASFIDRRVTTDHKGEFLFSMSPEEPSFNPPPLPYDHVNNSKMVHITATSYVVESASYAYWRAGLMKYNLSSDKLGPFDTTDEWCPLTSQELCKKFPHKKVMFSINATTYPTLEITEDGALMNATATGSMYVDNNGTMDLAFSLIMILTADAHPRLEYKNATQLYNLCGNVANPRVKISVGKSNIGQFNLSLLESAIEKIAVPFGIGLINEYAEAGVPIPSIDGVYLRNTTLHLGNSFIMFTTDVYYDKTSETACIYNTRESTIY